MTQPKLPGLHAVNPRGLQGALEDALSRHYGAACRVEGLERRHFAYSTSFAIEELDVRLEDGSRMQILFKDVSRQALAVGAQEAKPSFLHEPTREIEIYRAILSGSELGTATCYGAVVEPDAGRYWLFLEKVAGLELYQIGELGTWQQAARWLAGLHGRFAGDAVRLQQAAPLLVYDGPYYRRWLERARTFHRNTAAGPFLERLAPAYDRVVERLLTLPATLIHGEFYASNVLVQELGNEIRVCPVDWEVAAVGPGLVDLAALIAGKWSEEEKKVLAEAYQAALAPSLDEGFLEALDYCRLHLAVQWLGWAAEWTPPAEHTHDWLSEASWLAGKLGLAS